MIGRVIKGVGMIQMGNEKDSELFVSVLNNLSNADDLGKPCLPLPAAGRGPPSPQTSIASMIHFVYWFCGDLSRNTFSLFAFLYFLSLISLSV